MQSLHGKQAPNTHTHLSGQEKARVGGEFDPLLADALLLQLGHEVPVHDALARIVDL